MWRELIEKNKYIIFSILVIVIFGLIYFNFKEYLVIQTGDGDTDAGLCRESCAHCRKNCPFKRYNRSCECSYCDNNNCPFGN